MLEEEGRYGWVGCLFTSATELIRGSRSPLEAGACLPSSLRALRGLPAHCESGSGSGFVTV